MPARARALNHSKQKQHRVLSQMNSMLPMLALARPPEIAITATTLTINAAADFSNSFLAPIAGQQKKT